MLEVKVKLEDEAGKKPDPNVRVAPSANIMNSLFKTCNVWIQGQLVSECKHHPYRTYMASTMSYSAAVKVKQGNTDWTSLISLVSI